MSLYFQSRPSKERKGEGDCPDWSTCTLYIMSLYFQSRPSKERKGEGDCPDWSPYGCHYQPDPEEFPIPRIGKSFKIHSQSLEGILKTGQIGKISYILPKSFFKFFIIINTIHSYDLHFLVFNEMNLIYVHT